MKNRNVFILVIGLLTLAAVVVCFVLILHKIRPSSPGVVVFSSFSPQNTFRPNSWAAGASAHADWFVPDASGRLNEIKIAIEPNYSGTGVENTAGDLDLFLAADENGFPGTVLEDFSRAAKAPGSRSPSLPLVFKSVARPELVAGTKYWLCAKGSGAGGWIWHFGDPALVRNAAREGGPGNWMSAGDYCYSGAFSISVLTNRTLPGSADGTRN
jgi:hypothetical protein